MASTRDISRTEQRIAEVDALQQTIDRLRGDLTAYGEALRQELAWLEEQISNGPAVVSPAAPSPPAAPRQPTPPPRQPTPPPRQLTPPPRQQPVEEPPAELEFTDLEEVQAAADSQQPQRKQSSPFELDEPGPGEEDKIGGKPVSVLITADGISDEPLTGWVIDRPPGGLKILCDDEIQVSTVIGIRPNRDHPDAQWINVSVKNVRSERQSFVLTCQFVERPPWNALALFN
jgi:hypothetical protein